MIRPSRRSSSTSIRPAAKPTAPASLRRRCYAARGKKPIIAYVGGTGASAAYWLASAADKVVISPTAVLGSIGVQVAYREAAAKAGEKTYRFVSSQSPNKNPELGTPRPTSRSRPPSTPWPPSLWPTSRAIAAWLPKRSSQTSAKAASLSDKQRWTPASPIPSGLLKRCWRN
jgi:hypothetical protein